MFKNPWKVIFAFLILFWSLVAVYIYGVAK